MEVTVTKEGKVYDTATGKILNPNVNGFVKINKKLVLAKKLIVNEFLYPAPAKHYWEWIDGNKRNNHPDNFVLKSICYNRNKNRSKKQKNPSVLSYTDVKEIHVLHGKGWKQTAIAKKFGVSQASICYYLKKEVVEIYNNYYLV